MKIVKNTDNAVLKDKSEVSDKEAEEAFKTILRWICLLYTSDAADE